MRPSRVRPTFGSVQGRPDPLLEIASLASLKYTSNPHPPLARSRMRRVPSLASESAPSESEPTALRARDMQIEALRQDAPDVTAATAAAPTAAAAVAAPLRTDAKMQRTPSKDHGTASPQVSPRARPGSVRMREGPAALSPIKPKGSAHSSPRGPGGSASAFARPRGSARVGSARPLGPVGGGDTRSPRAQKEVLARQERDLERQKSREKERSLATSAVSTNFAPLRDMAAFMQCIGALTPVQDSISLLKEVMNRELSKFFGASRVLFYLVSGDKLYPTHTHTPRFDLPDDSVTISVTRGIIGEVALTGKPANVRAAKMHPKFDSDVDGNAESILAVAIGDFGPEHSSKGVVALLDKKDAPSAGFNAEDQAALVQLVPFILAAVRNTRAVVRRQALLEGAREISAELETPQLYGLIVAKAKQLFGCETARIVLINSATGDLFVTPTTPDEEAQPIPERRGLAGHVINTGEVLTMPTDPTKHPHWNREADHPPGVLVVRNLIAWPIVNNQNMMGALLMYNLRSLSAFTPDDDGLLKTFVQQVSESIQNAGVLGKTVGGYHAAVSTQMKYQALLQVAQSLALHLESGELIVQILQRARELVDAERSSLFLIDLETNELVSQVAEGEEGGIRAPMGQGIIGHVATTGEVLNIADAYADSRFNVEIDRKTKYKTRNIICVPIRDGTQENVIGVTEIINKRTGSFTKEDEELLKAFSVFCGLALNNSKLYDEAIIQQRKARALLDVVLALTGDNQVAPLLTTIMTRARELISADRAALFVLDPKNKELRTQVADGSGEIVLPNHPGSIAGYVATTGQDIAIADAYADERFNPGIDRQTGYQTRSVLAIPILNDKGEVIAVTEMINKQGGAAFKEEDRLLVKAFANFCGRSLSDMVTSYHASRPTAVHYPLVSMRPEDREAVLTWNFNVNSFTDPETQIRLVVAMFEDLKLLEEFKIPMPTFLAFLHELSRSYNIVPYHNFMHAIDATQFMFMMLRTSAKLQATLTRLEILGVMLAGLLHDIDHGGLNNAFQVNAQTPLAMLFQNRSIMESYHVSRSIAILSNDSFNVLAALSEPDRQYLWNFLIGTILATDMASHFSLLAEFDPIAKGKTQYETQAHHKLLGKMVMKSGDISNVCRPFDLAKEWAGILLSEFFRQGEMEKQKGLPLSPFMDSQHVVMAQMQLGFINSIAMPMFDVVATFAPDLRPGTTDELKANSARWAAILADSTSAAANAARAAKEEEEHRHQHGAEEDEEAESSTTSDATAKKP